MDVKETYRSLQQQWVKARGEERERVQQQLDSFFVSLSEDEKKSVCEAVSDNLNDIHREIDEIKEIKLRDKMESILPVISVSYLAKHYFNKSSSWFYQRLNGNKVHGKAVSFTASELDVLSKALDEIGRKFIDTSSLLTR